LPRGGNFDKRNVVIIESMGGLPRGRNVAKRNVVIIESMGWVAKGEGNVDKRNVKILKKRNVVLEPESLKAWVAKGGGQIWIKRM